MTSGHVIAITLHCAWQRVNPDGPASGQDCSRGVQREEFAQRRSEPQRVFAHAELWNPFLWGFGP
jgi:hypothetical protein